jgi:hypothetical protein
VYGDTPRDRVKPIVLVVLRRGSKAKERREVWGRRPLCIGGAKLSEAPELSEMSQGPGQGRNIRKVAKEKLKKV